MLPIGGSGSQLTSECHSSPATCLDFSSALMTSTSGCSPPRVEVGCRCSSPKRRPNALCCSWLSSWSRKKITRFAIRASYLLKGLVAQWLGEIDTKDLRADTGRELAHLDRLVAHWLSSLLPQAYARKRP